MFCGMVCLPFLEEGTGRAAAGAGVEYAGVHLDFAWMFAGHECLARNTFWISLGYSF